MYLSSTSLLILKEKCPSDYIPTCLVTLALLTPYVYQSKCLSTYMTSIVIRISIILINISITTSR